MLALLKRNFILYFRNRSGVFFSLLGALISFLLYIIFLQKNLTDAWSQLPDNTKLLNNWLMGGDLGCDWDYNQFYGSYTNGTGS